VISKALWLLGPYIQGTTDPIAINKKGIHTIINHSVSGQKQTIPFTKQNQHVLDPMEFKKLTPITDMISTDQFIIVQFLVYGMQKTSFVRSCQYELKVYPLTRHFQLALNEFLLSHTFCSVDEFVNHM
jgi:hypothetical protein